jgi:hypothetical protein
VEKGFSVPALTMVGLVMMAWEIKRLIKTRDNARVPVRSEGLGAAEVKKFADCAGRAGAVRLASERRLGGRDGR